MIKHTVMFRLSAEGEQLADICRRFKEGLAALPPVIEGLDAMEAHVNGVPAEGNWNVVLTATCPDAQALAAYAGHPAHLACVAIIKPFIAGRACVDYTV